LQNMWEVLFENNMEVFFPRSIVLCWFFPNHIKLLHRKSSQEYQKSFSGFRVLHCLQVFLLNVANMGGFLPDSSRVTIIRRFKVVYIGSVLSKVCIVQYFVSSLVFNCDSIVIIEKGTVIANDPFIPLRNKSASFHNKFKERLPRD
jgi:hypothetical protein